MFGCSGPPYGAVEGPSIGVQWALMDTDRLMHRRMRNTCLQQLFYKLSIDLESQKSAPHPNLTNHRSAIVMGVCNTVSPATCIAFAVGREEPHATTALARHL
jgi:hypothetical protein